MSVFQIKYIYKFSSETMYVFGAQELPSKVNCLTQYLKLQGI